MEEEEEGAEGPVQCLSPPFQRSRVVTRFESDVLGLAEKKENG